VSVNPRDGRSAQASAQRGDPSTAPGVRRPVPAVRRGKRRSTTSTCWSAASLRTRRPSAWRGASTHPRRDHGHEFPTTRSRTVVVRPRGRASARPVLHFGRTVRTVCRRGGRPQDWGPHAIAPCPAVLTETSGECHRQREHGQRAAWAATQLGQVSRDLGALARAACDTGRAVRRPTGLGRVRQGALRRLCGAEAQKEEMWHDHASDSPVARALSSAPSGAARRGPPSRA